MVGNSGHIFQKTQVSALQKQVNESVETEIRTIFCTHQSFLYLTIPTPRKVIVEAVCRHEAAKRHQFQIILRKRIFFLNVISMRKFSS